MPSDVQRWQTTGKRKTAIARVLLVPGTGTITVNKRTLEDYFPRLPLRTVLRRPLALAECEALYDVIANVRGGGPTGQAEAIRHGIARALVLADAARRPTIKKAGLLTRDARKKERKKYGQPGARKRFQYSKR
ncbi:MAG: 30S ribosomal protein S9 [Deltaproteobacteria bacterium]|nr:30S ribosomal protein S9 [Deltaproteobacteria bacterium]